MFASHPTRKAPSATILSINNLSKTKDEHSAILNTSSRVHGLSHYTYNYTHKSKGGKAPDT